MDRLLPSLRRVTDALLENAPAGADTEAHLRAAITEAVQGTGRLVRPRLALAAGEAAGLPAPAAMKLACAVEYFHSASLLLDDLPCMDDAALRRGRPCAHRVHGEATAILAALALINRAHTLIGVALAAQPGERRLAAVAWVDACLGASGLVDGQARDLRFAETGGGVSAVTRIARRKTAALFELTLCLPAIAGRTPPAEWRLLRRLGLFWGLACQGADDLADVLASPVDEGKTTGRDAVRGRPNLALAIGVPAARRRLVRLVRLAERTVERLVAADGRWVFLRAGQVLLGERALVQAGQVAA